MDRIAHSLVSERRIDTFSVEDVDYVKRTNALVPFVWVVTEELTGIYEMDAKAEWVKDLIKTMDYLESSGLEYCLYVYDGDGLFPVFPKAIREQAGKQI